MLATRFNGGFPAPAIAQELDKAFNWLASNAAEAKGVARYPVNVTEDADAFHVEAELPGFTREQVEVKLDDDLLTIKAERSVEPQEGVKTVINERRHTKATRSFTLPPIADPANIEAKLADGVLYLTVGKRAEAKPRTINVS